MFQNGHIEILPKIWTFQNTSNSIVDQDDISLICTKFGTSIIIDVIVQNKLHIFAIINYLYDIVVKFGIMISI